MNVPGVSSGLPAISPSFPQNQAAQERGGKGKAFASVTWEPVKTGVVATKMAYIPSGRFLNKLMMPVFALLCGRAPEDLSTWSLVEKV